MDHAGRRDFLKHVAALSAVTIVTGWQPDPARAGTAPERPGGKMELKVSEVEFLLSADASR